MKKDFINKEFIEGRLYQHNLVMKTVKNELTKGQFLCVWFLNIQIVCMDLFNFHSENKLR